MRNSFPDKVAEYLEKKSFGQWNLEWEEESGIEAVIVIPAICEFENIKKLIATLTLNPKSYLQKSLIIFVVNNSVSSSPEVKADNKLSILYIRKLIENNPPDLLTEQILASGIRVGLIDAASDGKEFDDTIAGVGLARKIGMDTALQIFDYSNFNRKIIISLDADCLVEKNYLPELHKFFKRESVVVATINFEHFYPEGQKNKLGILSYEIFLRHYVAGLFFADSPFAFHTIGSTIVFDHEAYVKVEGMNTKKAAEDFYFLEKLAKHYKIDRINSTKVIPSARESWRVPFGTGRSMIDYATNKKDILLFDPEVYKILKEWLLLFNSDLSLNIDLIIKEAKLIHPELYNFLENRKFQKNWAKILINSKSIKQLDYQRKNWFDAFETLKLFHHLRDTTFPMLDIKTGIQKLFDLVNCSPKSASVFEKDDEELLFILYLSELKELENNLHKKLHV